MMTENECQMKTLTANIAGLRKENRLSKKEMAVLMGISAHGVTQIENGNLPPRMQLSALFRVCNYFGYSPKTLFTQNLEKKTADKE